MKDEDILLRLNRKYSKDEEIKLMFQQLRVQIGEQKSYIHELEDKLSKTKEDEGKIKQLENIIKSLKEENKNMRSGEVYGSLRNIINERNKKIAELHQTVNGLIQKLHFPKVA